MCSTHPLDLPPVPNLGPTFGTAYISIVVSAMFYGVTCLQTFIYFMNAGKDPIWIKLLVIATLLIDTLHEALLIHVGYYYFIQNFFNPIALDSGVWSIISQIFISGTAAFLVESFMVWHLYQLSNHNYLLTIPAMILAMAHLGVDFAWPIQAFLGPDLSFTRVKGLTVHLTSSFSSLAVYHLLQPTAISGFIIGSVTDVYISGTLAYFLWSSRTGFKRSNDMIYRLIQYAITTGLLTTVDNIISLVLYVVRTDLYYMFFSFMMAKLYINSFLATLNSRRSIREAGGTEMISITGSQSVPGSTTIRVQVSTMKFADSFKEPDKVEGSMQDKSSLVY
ncbi:hypothetical protein BDZ97DRAFT_1914862 [Flammula alnicola]|nr:hypothetical protein BDZ97DRAFT_1914862 [Flammula alnicola]